MPVQNCDSKNVLCRHGYSFVRYHPQTSWWWYLRPMSVVQVQIRSVTFQSSSSQIKWGAFFATSYRNEIRRWERSHCVQVFETDRLICILTSSCHQLPVRSHGLRLPEFIDWSWHFGVKKILARMCFDKDARLRLHYFSNILPWKVIIEKLCGCLRLLAWPHGSTVWPKVTNIPSPHIVTGNMLVVSRNP